jgi:D-alanyl-lipoteichoic acid acyltransferase DltB (MBOAT superfamily)
MSMKMEQLTVVLEILVPCVLWQFKNHEKSEKSKNHWNTFFVSNLLSIFVIFILDIHNISCNQSGHETKGLILVIEESMGDGSDYNHVGCTLKEHQKVGA